MSGLLVICEVDIAEMLGKLPYYFEEGRLGHSYTYFFEEGVKLATDDMILEIMSLLKKNELEAFYFVSRHFFPAGLMELLSVTFEGE